MEAATTDKETIESAKALKEIKAIFSCVNCVFCNKGMYYTHCRFCQFPDDLQRMLNLANGHVSLNFTPKSEEIAAKAREAVAGRQIALFWTPVKLEASK